MPLTIRSILVATDLSEESDYLLRAAAAVTSAVGAGLHVVHAFDFQPLPYREAEPAGSTFPERVAAAERALDEQIRRAIPSGVAVASCRVVIYVAHKAILDRAEQVAADLIVLGPHRARGLGDRFLGSTADRVIRASEAPCLIIRNGFSLPLRRVVAPIDLSEPARAALDVALAWSAALGAASPGRPAVELHVLHVIPRVFDARDYPLDERMIGPRLEEELRGALRRVGEEGKAAVTQVIRWGESPADEILRYAEEEGADLLVLGTHGHGVVVRALIGSVASAVARRAHCPILLVPPALRQTKSRR